MLANRTKNSNAQDGTPIEPVTGAVPTTDSNHMQVHLKRAYTLGYSAQLAAGAVMSLAMQIPAGAYVHFQSARLIFGGAIKVEFFEGATFAGGVASIPRNKHRITPTRVSVVTVKKGVTSVTGGLDLFDGPLFLGASGAVNRASIGGATGDDSEWVWNPGTDYVIRITSLEPTLAINVTLIPFWYEEPTA